MKDAANADWLLGIDLGAVTGAENVVMVVVTGLTVVLLSLAIGIAVEGSGVVVSTEKMVLTGSRRIWVLFHPEANHRSAFFRDDGSTTVFSATHEMELETFLSLSLSFSFDFCFCDNQRGRESGGEYMGVSSWVWLKWGRGWGSKRVYSRKGKRKIIWQWKKQKRTEIATDKKQMSNQMTSINFLFSSRGGDRKSVV